MSHGSDAQHETDLSELLDQLRQVGARLWLDQGALKCDAPKGAVTQQLRDRLRACKPEIMARLRADQQHIRNDDWQVDAQLPVHITSNGSKIGMCHSPRVILLTGATGFLGAFLLAELMRQTQATIICLVRPDRGLTNPEEQHQTASDRLTNVIENYGLTSSVDTSRLEVMAGDLKQPEWGIPKNQYQELCERIDAIIHNGAHVHHGLPYKNLKITNVHGTLESIKFAFKSRVPLHFISSLSVLPPQLVQGFKRYYETDSLKTTPVPSGGYNRSKWVAERLVEQAADRGLPVTVFRPGPISGHSKTGVFNRQDFLYRLVLGYMESGMAPDGAMHLDPLPVDFVSQAMIWLSVGGGGSSQASQFARYHLLHPKPASSDLVFDACCEAGMPIKRVPYATWFQHLKRIAEEKNIQHPLYPLVALFASRTHAISNSSENLDPLPFDCSRAMTALEKAPFVLPELNQDLFRTYLRAMTRQGLESTSNIVGGVRK